MNYDLIQLKENKLEIQVYQKRKFLLLFLSLLLLFFFSKKDFQGTFRSQQNGGTASGDGATKSNSNLIYEETFEGKKYFPLQGNSIHKTYSIENCGLDWTLSTVSNPVFQGNRSCRFEVRKDQPLVGRAQRHRSEVVIIKGDEDPKFTPDIWYSFAVLFPSAGMETDTLSRDIINQWFEDADRDNTIKVDKGKVYFEATPNTGSTTKLRFDLFSQTISKPQSNNVSDMVNIPKDEWHEFVFHFIHSFDSDGLIEIWRDGVKIHNIAGRTMHLRYPKWKIGMYKSTMPHSLKYSRVIYFDNIRVGKKGSTLSDLVSNQVQPTASSAALR